MTAKEHSLGGAPVPMNTTNPLLVLGLVAGLVLPSVAWSWGTEGHRLTGFVAERHLNGKAKAAIAKLWPDTPLWRIATLMDEDKNADGYDRSRTKWHFDDIPLCSPADRQQYCPEDNCASARTHQYLGVLANGTDADKKDAVKFITHMAGDIHQPLHSAENNDRGGNEVQTLLNGRPVKLHIAWDSALLDIALKRFLKNHEQDLRYEAERIASTYAKRYGHEAWKEVRRLTGEADKARNSITQLDAIDGSEGSNSQKHGMLLQWLPKYADSLHGAYKVEEDWKSGSIENWIGEAHDLARAEVYGKLPGQTGECPVHLPKEVTIGEKYIDSAIPVVNRQLMKAGVRIAQLFNSTLGRCGAGDDSGNGAYCFQAPDGAFAAEHVNIKTVQDERDLIFGLLAYAVVFADWQDDENGRGHNIGSVLVDDNTGRPVYWARNSSKGTHNSTQHGEVRLITNYLNCGGSPANGKTRYLKGSYSIYTTLEPCVMCSGMMTLTQVGRTVYGQTDPAYGNAIETLKLRNYPNLPRSQALNSEIRRGLDANFQAQCPVADQKKGTCSVTAFLRSGDAKSAFRTASERLRNQSPNNLRFAENRAILDAAQEFVFGPKNTDGIRHGGIGKDMEDFQKQCPPGFAESLH